MQVRDRDDVKWTVRRVWWPFGTWLLDLPEWGGLFVLGIVLTALLVVIWPFWLATRFLGVPWRLIIRREGKEVRRETVKGWQASRSRIADLLDELRGEGGPELPAGATIV